MENFEKLGAFYLGRVYDLKRNQTKEDLLLYDSKDLVTHGVCVGMTGSGKTGLCISLIEEAAIDGVPSILIDPKGDLCNLLLTFPNLTGQDFLPWINLDDARNKGMTPIDFANKQAETWKTGLAGWGEDGARIQRLRSAADMLIYTPGSNAGFPVNILKSFFPPPSAIMEDEDLLRDRIGTTVTSLLGLAGIEADPVQSREHILLATILDIAWRKGQDLDLAAIIQQVQEPPVSKIGVLDLESFYSSKDRFALVIALNNLLASPGFNVWMQGTPLDIGQILYTQTGKPRIAIFSISHLSDAERMFFVSLLMNEILGWMRGQSGTTSLRAIVYMDEVFGFLPPTAMPPSKLPLITLLKQARAFGIGMLLSTQNPVDLDYKALGNAGTWFIGRLQTERDKGRLLDGLESVASSSGTSFNRSEIESIISSLGNRIFLMNNTHEDHPEIFQTRWALSYLRGPLTRDQIKILMEPLKSELIVPSSESGSQVAATVPSQSIPVPSSSTEQTTLSPDISSFYIPCRGNPPSGNTLMYLPKILGAAKINFADKKLGIEYSDSKIYMTPVTDNAIPVVWEDAIEIDVPAADLEKVPTSGARFGNLPLIATQGKNYTNWTRDFSNWLYGSQKVDLFRSPNLNDISNQNESEQEFRLRLQQTSRERRDEMVEQIRKKFASKNATLEERLRRAQQAAEKQAEQAKQAKFQTAISLGSTLLTAFTSRKVGSTTISRASTAMRSASRAIDESKDVSRAGDTVDSIKKQIADLQAEFNNAVADLEDKINPIQEQLEIVHVKPKKTDIQVQLVSLVWAPHWQDPQGNLLPAW